MVGDEPLLLRRDYHVPALQAAHDSVDGAEEILASDELLVVPCCNKGRLVADIGDIGTGETRRLLGEKIAVEIGVEFDVAQVHVEYLRPLLDVGQSDLYLPVETPRTHERLVENVGPVRGGKNDDARIGTETVHLRQELVQGLLPLIVAADLTVTFFADGIDLVDEYDAGSLLLGLLEKVTDLGSTHAHEHLHEFGAGHGEEGHVGFTGHGLGQHSLAGTRRANQQDALGHGSTDLLILTGVMEIIDDLRQILLGLVLTGHVVKANSLGGLHIHLGIGLAHIEHHGITAAHFLHQLPGHELPQGDEDQNGGHPAQNIHEQGGLLDLLAAGRNTGLQQSLDKLAVRGDHSGLVDGFFILAGEQDPVVGLLDLRPADLALFRHRHKGVVVHLLNLILGQPGHGDEVEQHHQQHGHHVVEDQRLFRGMDLIHGSFLLSLGAETDRNSASELVCILWITAILARRGKRVQKTICERKTAGFAFAARLTGSLRLFLNKFRERWSRRRSISAVGRLPDRKQTGRPRLSVGNVTVLM